MEACDRLRAAGQQFTLTIIGDGELRDSLQAEIERRALGGCVTLAGAASSAEIREALCAPVPSCSRASLRGCRWS